MTPPFIVRRTSEADWQNVRDLRLEMLADTPLAYGETVEAALSRPEPEWRIRAARGDGPGTTAVVAIDTITGRWIGTMGGFLGGFGSTGPLLVGVYVAPGSRGRAAGVADALLDAVEDWARGHGSTLSLHVHEDNTRAIAFYERRGFTFTGVSAPYDLAPSRRELEMQRTLPTVHAPTGRHA
ncbi:GNAT family N-acetyltransferase [Cellulomonas sp. P24]|uniref:GNAT family N-acetyltransferase n=1 Tax=Cellulomonas sp. P24 TaxID=2885206 RepID=UPI00216AFA38|nr:GNAT family N-acetyltransferase [Cellulomonas sp. P24]MCR6493992.1 GNAT family N-acetyltransferase [Cellulomonas sp. P24]